MTIYILDSLDQLPEMLRRLGPNDCIQIPSALGGTVCNTFHSHDFNRMAHEGRTFGMKLNQGDITMMVVDEFAQIQVLSIDKKPQKNRGPQGHLETWKRRGRKGK